MTPEDEIVHKDWDKYPVGAYEKALSEPTAFGRLLIEAARAARLEALEEAAKIAETVKTGPVYYVNGVPNAGSVIRGDIIAAAIRERAKAE